MKKNILKYILIIIIIIAIISAIIVSYSFMDKSNSGDDIYDKIEQELEYLDTSLISVINSLNNLDTDYLLTMNDVTSSKSNNGVSSSTGGSSGTSGSSKNSESSSSSGNSQSNSISISTIDPKSILTRDRDDIDWSYIQTTLEQINNSWTIATIDLKSVNVSNDDILAFNTNMDIALSYVKAKDKQNSLISIANVYSLIPKYKEQSSQNGWDKNVSLAYVKSDIVSSYALLDISKWDNISSLLNDADSKVSDLINTEDTNNQNTQEIYILLKDYIKSTNDNNVDLCYMKYYYLIKEFENI